MPAYIIIANLLVAIADVGAVIVYDMLEPKLVVAAATCVFVVKS